MFNLSHAGIIKIEHFLVIHKLAAITGMIVVQYYTIITLLRFGIPFGTAPPLEDSLWKGLEDPGIKMPMVITAENLAVMHDISREECDAYAVQSQTRCSIITFNKMSALKVIRVL